MAADHRPVAPIAWRLLLALAAVRLVAWALVGGRYGFHRDELYYLVGGRHLELGYVDHPFVVPWLARLSEELFGLSLHGLRLPAALAGAAVVLLAGLLARRLGGGRWAQGLAAAATLVGPFHLMAANLLQTVPIDQLVWLGATLVLAHLLAGADPRWWLLFGAIAGAGLVTKYTVLVFGGAVVVALLLTPRRRVLAERWIWLGGLVAAAIFLPNLLWQIDHGFPSLEFIAANSAAERVAPPGFLALQAIFIGPFSLPLFACGLAFLFSSRERRFRPLGWLAVVVFALLLAVQGKPYYAAPLYPLLFAAGAVWLEARLAGRRGWRRAWPAWLLAGNLAAVPIFLPVLPVAVYARAHDGFPHPEFGEMFGWPELVAAVGEAWRALPEPTRSEAVLVTSSYGSAAAIELWGAEAGLPKPSCAHNSYYLWSRPASIDPAVAVGFRREWVEEWYEEVVELGVVANDQGIRNEEAGRPILLLRGARLSPDEAWQRLRTFR